MSLRPFYPSLILFGIVASSASVSFAADASSMPPAESNSVSIWGLLLLVILLAAIGRQLLRLLKPASRW